MTDIIKKLNADKNTEKSKADPVSIFSRIILALSFITVIYYMLGPSEGYLHSDCVDTIVWAQNSVESGRIFSSTACYPCLLPFGATFLMFPFIKILGFTMFAYRLSMLAFMLLFTTALYFMLRGMKWNRNICLVTIALELIVVSSSQKLRELFWEHIIHYSLGAFLSFALLAMIFAFMVHYDENTSLKGNKKAIALAVCTALWSFFSAFDGITTLALSSAPIIAALLIEIFMDSSTRIFSKANRSIAVSALIVTAATVLGSIFLKIAAGDISTSYESAYSVIVNNEEWGQNLLNFLRHWTSLMGADYRSGESITKAANILAAFKMAGSLVLFGVPVYALFTYKKFNRAERIFLFYHWIMTAFILYGFIFGNLSGVNWRLSPIACSALVINVAVWKKLWSTVNSGRALAAVSIFVIISCIITTGQIITMPSDYGRDDDHHKAIELLEANGLDYGYATYWNANILTLLSSSKVKARDIVIDGDDIQKGWLNTDTAWFEDQPGQDKYFVLLTNGEYDSAVERNHVILENTIDTIREGNWVILVKDRNIF